MKTRTSPTFPSCLLSISHWKYTASCCCLFFISVWSIQGQCPNDLITTLTTQAEVDGFSAAYPGCTHMTGSLTIGPSADITHLNGLSDLEGIGVRLTISGNAALTDMSGLSNLTAIGRDVVITNNPVLTEIDLEEVSGAISDDFHIANNAALEDLIAPVNLTSIGNNLLIVNNPNLVNLTGLENLTSVGRLFRIMNTLENDFPDFSNLTSVGQDIVIEDNANVTYLNFQNVAGSLSASFKISRNPALLTLDAPVNLHSVGEDIFISFNSNLNTINGLENILTIGQYLYIDNNAVGNLPDFSTITSIGRLVYIAFNPNIPSIDLHNVGGVIGAGESNAGINIIQNASLSALAAPEPLTAVNGTITVGFNPNLSIFTGFGNLTSVNQTLWFSDITTADFPEMPHLSTIGGSLVIAANTGVENLDWIGNLQSIGQSLRINHNPLLSFCAIEAVCDFLAGTGTRFISNNTGCCLNESVLTDACNQISSGTGEVCDGEDNDCDGLIDEGFDQDGDGFTACAGDCDDTDPHNYPGNSEVCDGQDNDCDGSVDEGFDLDGDGIANCADNCPDTANPDQADADCDGAGDICDQWPGCDDQADSDNDGTPDCIDLDELANWACGSKGDMVYVCHYPPGHPENRQTICISPNAVDVHLGHHGDYIGECDQMACSGEFRPAPGANLPIEQADHLASVDFHLFPNPTGGVVALDLHHSLGQRISISVQNQLGLQVFALPEQELHSPVIHIDLKKLPNGIYLLTVQTPEGWQTKQFIITQ